MSTHTKTVLLTGGTGFIGTPLSERFLKAGYTVYVLTRTAHVRNKDNQSLIRYFSDFQEISDLQIDVVINLAGESIAQRWSGLAKQKILQSRMHTTQKLIEFMTQSAIKPKILISGSAIGYYGIDDHSMCYEDTLSKEDGLFSTYVCQEWEKAAKLAVHLGVRTVYLRIGPVLDKQGGMLQKLWLSFYFGLGSCLGHGKQWLSWIDREDVTTQVPQNQERFRRHGM
jgi:uncharacterized protein (TIGR01777 family)